MSTFDDWYETTGDLAQGAIFKGIPFVTMDDTKPLGSSSFTTRNSDFVVLTQTCDLPKKTQRTVLLCELISYDFVAKTNTAFGSSELKTSLARGIAIAEFLLPPNDALGLGWTLAYFRSLYVVPKSQLMAATSAISVASPYREHLAQAYARFTMRVGLPSPLHEFEAYTPA